MTIVPWKKLITILKQPFRSKVPRSSSIQQRGLTMGKRSQISRQTGIQASNSAAFLSSRLDLVGVWRWFCRQSTVEVQDLSWDAQNPGAKVTWVCQPTTNLNMLESEKNKNTDKGPVPAPMSQDASSSHQPVLLLSYRECWSSFFQWKSNCSDNKAKIWRAESGRVVFVQLQEGGGGVNISFWNYWNPQRCSCTDGIL